MTTTDPTTRPKLEAVVTLPEGVQAWVRFDADGTPHADLRHGEYGRSWTPIDKLGGSVEVAP